MRAKPLRIRTRQQRRRIENVAVDERQGTGIVEAAHGVEQERAVDAIESDPDVRGTLCAHGELRLEVVARRH